MSETREQFRERIGRMANEIFHEEVNDAAATIQEGGTLPPMFNFTGHGFECAAEAVYAQALRDVIDHMDLRFVVVGIDERDGNVRTAIDAIEAFAAERGIDLEDTP